MKVGGAKELVVLKGRRKGVNRCAKDVDIGNEGESGVGRLERCQNRYGRKSRLWRGGEKV